VAVITSANEIPVGEVSSTMDIKHKDVTDNVSDRSDSVDMAISLSSASSYSVITLKDSPAEVILDGRLSRDADTVPAAAAQVLDASEMKHQLNCTKHLPSNTLPCASPHALSTITTEAEVVTSFTDHCDAGLVSTSGVAMAVDHVEYKITLRNKLQLKVMEPVAGTYRYTMSFPYLPAILESCKSDDAQLSDSSVASGDGYVADGGLTRSESYPSNASSPAASLSNIAECSDQQHLSRDSDEAHFSVTSTSSDGEHMLHSEGESLAVLATVTSGSRQLSAKSLSDGIDSAVVCTPYSSQTSRDSSSTVDNSSCYHSASVVIDDQAPQPLPSAADETHPVSWRNGEVGQVAVNVIADEAACRGSVMKDSDDEVSIMSVKVEWDIESDSETAKHSGTNITKPPLPTVSTVQSLEEQSRELERRQRCGGLVTRRACCACASCVIMRQSVSTAADVIPTISVRLCSSVVDVVCLIRRLVVVCSTWLQVLCDSVHRVKRSRNAHIDQCGQETALMRSVSEDNAECTMRAVPVDVTDGSADGNSQLHCISQGLESVKESLLHRLFDVSDILWCCLF